MLLSIRLGRWCLLFGNTVTELLWEEMQVDNPVFLLPRGKLATGAMRYDGTWPGWWSKGALRLPQGQGGLYLLEEEGSAEEECQGPAWAGKLSQQHLPVPRHSPALVVL